jgi:3-hydroxyacyl-[acyl-carrier-protein] dehydratase
MAQLLNNGMRHAVEVDFAADHPTAPGHFPGNPILPGALLLDAVVIAVSGGSAAADITVRSVKFLRPVRPGSILRIVWEQKGEEIEFGCSLAATGEPAMTGLLRLRDGHG